MCTVGPRTIKRAIAVVGGGWYTNEHELQRSTS